MKRYITKTIKIFSKLYTDKCINKLTHDSVPKKKTKT